MKKPIKQWVEENDIILKKAMRARKKLDIGEPYQKTFKLTPDEWEQILHEIDIAAPTRQGFY